MAEELTWIPVTDENLDIATRLHISEAQAGTVETVEECVAEAKEVPHWRPIIVRRGGIDIGFAMYGLWVDEGKDGRAWLDRFFIDEQFQGRGYANEVLTPLLYYVGAECNRNAIFLSVYDSNAVAISIYKKLGFVFNGEFDVNGERVMELSLDKAGG